MKGLIIATLGLAYVSSSYGATINISTGVASWQVSGPGVSTVQATTLSLAQQNSAWAVPPVGSNWISWGSVQGTSCLVGQTPGTGCANTLTNAAGDTWLYTLTISSLTLVGATSGALNFIYGSDNRVSLTVGLNNGVNTWNNGTNTNGNAFNTLGCSGDGDVGKTQATYNNCVTLLTFNASNLNADGSLTISATNQNDPIPSVNAGQLCPQCGNPTGFILAGFISNTGNGAGAAAPEPATFGLIALFGVAGLAFRRKRS